MPTIAITGASGKLGGATLAGILAHHEKLLPPPSSSHLLSIIALTSSRPGSATWDRLLATAATTNDSNGSDGGEGGGDDDRKVRVEVRHASFEDPASFEAALEGVDRFFLVSTPHIALDFEDDEEEKGEGGEGKKKARAGRETHHRVAIDAAVRAGVGHVVYASLAYAFSSSSSGAGSGSGSGLGSGLGSSKAAVMRAHLRTEEYLGQLEREGKLARVTIVREGLYSESWPLYLGYFGSDGVDEREEVVVAGDGKVCWTGIGDLGVACAVVLLAPGDEEKGRTLFYLSTRPAAARSLKEIAGLVGEARGKEVRVKIVDKEEYVRHYVEERGRERPAVRWWASTYEALEDGECLVDDPTLEALLERVGVRPTSIEETVRAMVKKL
ncbi:NAD(P)-binding protein [Hypoxylon fragiforme]|uniref:NAD(P)-binding protein n=1 Tax=Hypoxylon fragiforme TaxID=63214 RepID=UPI0020C5BDA6|nr:NAD(P)-binding protein [Hypoxylon fragiforme]KAI2611228.1 NAD(P)-binding protein [Hypoxylon fragiforme]